MQVNKKGVLATFAATAAVLSLAACGSGAKTPDDNGPASGEASNTGDGTKYKSAITQIVTHDSLDQSVEGFKAAIADAGLDVEYVESNANNDQQVIPSIVAQIAADKPDLVLAVATPMALGVAQDITDVPILFTAVTDPVGSGLVESWDAPGANMTGTSDKNPVKEQLELITQIVPDTKSIGVVYNPGEPNSAVQVEWVKEEAEKLNIEVVESGASETKDIPQAANVLDTDVIYVPTDNTIISALDSVLQVGEEKSIPVFAAEGDSVANGAVATYGLSYYNLGYQTGEMAIEILTNGGDPATMPVETQSDLLLYLNKGAAERMNVVFPQELLDSAAPENVFE